MTLTKKLLTQASTVALLLGMSLPSAHATGINDGYVALNTGAALTTGAATALDGTTNALLTSGHGTGSMSQIGLSTTNGGDVSLIGTIAGSGAYSGLYIYGDNTQGASGHATTINIGHSSTSQTASITSGTSQSGAVLAAIAVNNSNNSQIALGVSSGSTVAGVSGYSAIYQTSGYIEAGAATASGTNSGTLIIDNSGTITAAGGADTIHLSGGSMRGVTLYMGPGAVLSQTGNAHAFYDDAGASNFHYMETDGGTISNNSATAATVDFSAATGANVEIELYRGSIINSNAAGTAIMLGRSGDFLNINNSSVVITGAVSAATDGGGDVAFLQVGTFATNGNFGSASHKLSTVSFHDQSITQLNNSMYTYTLDLQSGSEVDVNANVNLVSGTFALDHATLSLGTHTVNLGSSGTGFSLGATGDSTVNLTIGATSNGKITSTGLVTVGGVSNLVINPTVSGATLQSGSEVVIIEGLASTSGITLSSAASSGGGGGSHGLLGGTSASYWTLGTANSGVDLYGNTISGDNVILTYTVSAGGASTDAHTITGVAVNGGNALNAGISTGAPTTLKTALQALTAVGDVVHAGNQLSGSTNRGTVEGAGSAISGTLNTVASRLDGLRGIDLGGTGISTGEEAFGGGVWMQGFGGLGVQGDRAGSAGYKFGGAGVALGADKLVEKDLRVGAAFSYAHTGIKDTGDNTGSSTNIKSYMGTIYSSYQGEPWYVDGSINFGVHTYDTARLVSFSGFSDEALGSHNGYQYTAKVSGGYPIALDPFVVTPIAGLNYTHLDQSSYTETSTNGSALNVGASHSNSFKSTLGSKVTLPVKVSTYKVVPEASAAWEHEYINKALSSTDSYAAGGSSFTTSQVKPALDAAKLGVGVTVKDGDGMSVALHYDAELKDRYVGHAGILQVRYDF